MSAKRFNLYDDPPTASSSEEVLGHSSSDEEVDDDSLKPETEKNLFSDSESWSEEESDHDSKNPVKKNPESSDSKKGKSSSKSAAKKRSSSEIDGAEVKKVKRVASGEDEKKISGGNGGGEETKKTYFQRVWTEEDEIVVLQRIIDYKTENGVSPLDDTNAFYQLVKDSISFDVSKIQFSEKLRSLKKKFENNLGKGKNGEEPTFSKLHDQKAFDLSKLIWGVNGIAPETAPKSKKKSKPKKVKQELVSSLPNGKNIEEDMANGMTELDSSFLKSYLAKSLARVGVDDLAAQQAWTMLASEDKKRIEEEWKTMQLRELEFFSEKSGFIHKVVTKMTEALRSNP